MAKYTNIGNDSITVRGITIKPGETKELKGFANDRNLIRYNEPIPAKKGKKKSSDHKPEVVTPARVDNKPQINQPEVKNEADKVNQTDPKKENNK